jgi:limonene-1,2-epoxide hydrolase
MCAEIHLNPRLVVERLVRALNDHDIDAFVECFDPLYHGEQPVHPDRAYRGRELVHKEWSEIMKRLLDLHAKVLRMASEKDTVWVEYSMTGTQKDKTRVELLGVAIHGVRNDRIIWGRIYLEPLRKPGAGMDAIAR